MDYVIRVARRGDIPVVLSLWREAQAHPTVTDDAEGLAHLLAHDPGALLLAEQSGTVVGSVIASWDGWRGSIYRLAVAPGHRRRGVGGRLLHAAEDRLAGVGARRLQAIVVETDLPARGFWDRSGWERQVERLRYVRN